MTQDEVEVLHEAMVAASPSALPRGGDAAGAEEGLVDLEGFESVLSRGDGDAVLNSRGVLLSNEG